MCIRDSIHSTMAELGAASVAFMWHWLARQSTSAPPRPPGRVLISGQLTEGRTVSLRCWRAEDIQAQHTVVSVLQDTASLAFLPWDTVHTLDEASTWIANFQQPGQGECIGVYLASTETTATPVGFAILHAEGAEAQIGYALTPSARGQGLGSAVVRLLCAHVFCSLGHVKAVGAGCEIENAASVRVLSKGGFEQTQPGRFVLTKERWASALKLRE
eukprot:TRINITY_DN33940_c0_g1_i1.p1 TRINITY_DN33940_c0_g1~~TRINITY_DN33940_c0_g1_i1.p1  ORF type:complete len:216 (-),score=45.02 TRINITY_DN33940_c0_g1_i1:145-792(-)